MIRLAKGLMAILLPGHCPGCERQLFDGESFICLHCRHTLARPSSRAMESLRNKFNLMIEYAYAHWAFIQYGKAQRIIHAVKYGGSRKPARHLGKEMGMLLPEELNGKLIPVPQHPIRTFRRGFNQACELARGISGSSGLEMQASLLQRKTNSGSQTSRSRLGRLEALENSVYVREGFKNDHYILVDDVVTTGATLQACATRILEKYPGSRISIVVAATV